MATVSSREGVIRFTADADVSSPSDPSARIASIVVHDQGNGAVVIRKGSVAGPIIFSYNPVAVATTAGSYNFDLFDCCTTGKGLYAELFAATVDIYVR